MLYMVTWIPSIYPSHVSIYTSTMDPSWDMLLNMFLFHSLQAVGIDHVDHVAMLLQKGVASQNIYDLQLADVALRRLNGDTWPLQHVPSKIGLLSPTHCGEIGHCASECLPHVHTFSLVFGSAACCSHGPLCLQHDIPKKRSTELEP